ncbi:MAG: GNAT family N-acetyltransferase [Beijerinckiaceae bacterium]
MGQSDITLRLATDADGEGISALLRAVFAEYEGCLFEPSEFPELVTPARAYAERGGALWLGEQRGAVVATLAIFPKALPGTWEISKVYCAAGLRGQGTAAQLLSMATAFAQARGGTQLVLFSDTRFTRGHGFYAKHGFQRMPGTRVLQDVSHSLEFGFSRALTGAAA